MEAVLGSLSPPFSIPSAHLSSRPIGPPSALFKRTCPRQRVEATSVLCCSSSGGSGPLEWWASFPANGRSRRQGKEVVFVAKRNKESKLDADGYGPIPGENELYFPEAVLLQKRKDQEDDATQPVFADAEEEKMVEFLNLQLESKVKLERMRHYEVVYLIHEDHFEEVNTVVDKVQDFIREKKGKIWRLNDWGMRKLAYKINKAKNANYILMNFEIESRHINDFKTMLDRDERIIRHLVIRRDSAITEDCPPPPLFQTEASEDDDDDDDDDDYDDNDGDVELEMDDIEGDDDFGENVFIVAEEEEDVDDVTQKETRKTKSKKIMGKASRS